MKHYGSRLCRGCGRLFTLTGPGDGPYCASCKEPAEPAGTRITAPEPAALTAAVKPETVASAPPPKPPRVRAPRPKNTATGRNSGAAAGQRTLPMLRALAGAPAGLTTPQLAELANSGSSWVNALGTVRQLMLKQEKRGRVKQAGSVPGDRTREVVLWKITEEGLRYVRGADGSDVHHEPTVDPKPEPDLDEPLYKLFPFPRTRTTAGAYGVLGHGGYWKLADLLYVTSWDLLAIPGLGERRLQAIREALATRGFVLVDELDPEELDEPSKPAPPVSQPRTDATADAPSTQAGKAPPEGRSKLGFMPRLPGG
jgi:hypothetical protein